MADLNKIYVYRITHVQNIPHMLQHGITHIHSANSNKNYLPIGDGSLIKSREAFQLPNGNSLGRYIPFYFGVRMPMLYVIQKGFNGVTPVAAKDIVYCVCSVAGIVHAGIDFVFTDGHAIDGFTSFYTPAEANNMDSIVDFKAVQAQYWKTDTDLDLKRRKEAEFLAAGDITPDAIIGFVVYNQETALSVQIMPGLTTQKIIVKPNYYF
ncbi:DUF4433 domain-containing protein [Terrimonas sp.]|uniref:type II toxin-antitoxin system toxin DNA ADP-ribosyl transferase DarT n=1 Tax=Terrimonas sp. TaxID=1914338 RepID=UPI000D522C02|nr:DUF4433 domain-containing protein [Terrimonas sp.]PVD51080.1 DUF4433 domain-containing protein [Terrimonas sp.]